MFLIDFCSLKNLRSASARPNRTRRSRRTPWRFAPRLIPLEVRALLSTITVTNDADSGTGSLRAAIAAASTGDTIKFAHSADGTITLTSGPIDIATGVDIDGPGAKKVAVNGDNSSSIFDVQGGVIASISGLTVTDGLYAVPGFGAGGIINNGTLTLSNCTVSGNSVASGSGIYGAGGILNSNTGTLTISGSTISGNTTGFGGGIINDGTLTATGSSFTGNSGEFGGGINSFQGPLNLTNCVVSDNSGGGISNYQADTSLTNCTVSNNTAGASSAGVGISSTSADVSLVNCTVSGNTGGGISVSGYTVGAPNPGLTVSDSSIVNNTENGYYAGGVGISSDNADVTITGSLIANNTAEGSLATFGGGIFMGTGFSQTAANVLTVTDCTFQGNQAIGTGPYGVGHGGAIFTEDFATVSVINSSFLDNSATGTNQAQGGAMELIGLVQGTVTGSLFADNQAVVTNTTPFNTDAGGGAIYNEDGIVPGALTISGSTFRQNLVQGGSRRRLAAGGAIQNIGYGVTLNLSSSLLVNNSATGGVGGVRGRALPDPGSGTGGALDNFVGAIANVTDSTFLGNSATGGADSRPAARADPAMVARSRTALRPSL